MTKLFYFTGTGNTLSVARDVAFLLENAEVEPMTTGNPVIGKDVTTVGIFFPVHGWGMPKIVRDFVDRLENISGKYVFAVCTYGGTLFASLKTMERRLRLKNARLSAGFGIRMPVNYIPIFTVLPEKRRDRTIEKAHQKIERVIAPTVSAQQERAIEIWPVPVINSLLLAMNNSMVANMADQDKKFRTTDSCNGCEICSQICPVGNITMRDNRPVWNHSCTMCLGCLHWCPQAAIQYGKVPSSRGRYHHPLVTIGDMQKQQGNSANHRS